MRMRPGETAEEDWLESGDVCVCKEMHLNRALLHLIVGVGFGVFGSLS